VKLEATDKTMFKTSIPVFCYHNVSDVDGHSPALFAEHLDAIADAGYRTLTSHELLKVVRGDIKAPRKSVVITFDDGHLSNWLTCVPELTKRDMTGTFFVLTDFTAPGEARTVKTAPPIADMTKAFKAALTDQDFSQFINEGEARAMLNQGMEIFSHGCSHQGTYRSFRPDLTMGAPRAHWGSWGIYPGFNPDWQAFDMASAYVYDGFWPKLDETGKPQFKLRPTEERLAFCRKDFTRSFERIREINGKDEQLFCWPWGQFSNDARVELEKAGFAGAFTLERWANSRGTDPFKLNRIGVGKKKDGKWIQQRLSMYSSDTKARVFFKLLKKKPEVKSVLYATDSTNLSGGSRQMINNIEAMSSMGIRTHAILHPKSPLVEALDNMDVNIIPYKGFRKYLGAGRFLKEIIREHDIDVVHSFHNRAYKMGVIAKFLGAKFKLFINRGVISRPNDVFFLWTAFANGVICNSAECARVLRKHRVMKSRLNVVYNAFCGKDYGDPKPRKKRGTRFIYVGNAAHIKGHDIYLKAAAKLCEEGCRDMEFVSVGIKESEKKRFKEIYTPALLERWRSTDKIPHAEVLEELRFADVICVPSRLESFPNSLVEGFDLGLPGVCTSVGGIPEMLHDGVNGFLCQNEDANCLAEKMRYMADHPAERYNMGLVGRVVARKLLTPEAKAQGLMRVYMGEQLNNPLPIDEVAAGLELKDNPYDNCE